MTEGEAIMTEGERAEKAKDGRIEPSWGVKWV